jgi:four helix bundle protein
MPLQNYRELEVWKDAVDLTVEIYELFRQLPASEKYGLCDQARRAAVSIPANIAEGYGRQHRKEYLHFLSIAHASLCELETHLIVAGRLKFISREAAKQPWNLCQRVGQMLHKLRRSLRNKPGRGQPPE